MSVGSSFGARRNCGYNWAFAPLPQVFHLYFTAKAGSLRGIRLAAVPF
jgi:hypothetical protein